MTTPDEGVREIQLSGKQLVFLFMAVTVVSVVIFLCGVLVGRGVQARAGASTSAALTESEPVDDAGAPAAEPAPDTPTPRADVSFPQRLEKNETPPEKLVPRKDPPAKAATPAPAAATPPGSVAAPSTPAAKAAPTAPAATLVPDRPSPGIRPEPKGTGFAIQVAAFSARGEAETIVKRLSDKGYAVYLVTPQAGQPAMFRVRVGKFTERAEAERVAARLEREEQFKPWITR
jgi:cell division septation protein DedD